MRMLRGEWYAIHFSAPTDTRRANALVDQLLKNGWREESSNIKPTPPYNTVRVFVKTNYNTDDRPPSIPTVPQSGVEEFIRALDITN